MNETVKRVILWVVSIGGWTWAVGAATWAAISFDPSEGHFAPQWTTLSVFLSMGFAIAAGVSIGRINSVRTLAQIFQAGMDTAERAQRKRQEEHNDERDKAA